MACDRRRQIGWGGAGTPSRVRLPAQGGTRQVAASSGAWTRQPRSISSAWNRSCSLFARNLELICNHELDGEGIFVTELLSNFSARLADVPRRYLKSIKTDCLVLQDVPKKHRPAVERLLQMSHRDGAPVYRYEEVAGLRGQYREPSLEAEPIRAKPPWRQVEDPVSHCLDGRGCCSQAFRGPARLIWPRRLSRPSATKTRCTSSPV